MFVFIPSLLFVDAYLLYFSQLFYFYPSMTRRFVMTSVSSANKEQSLTEKEKKVERDNASKLAHALGIDMTVLNNSMALRALPLHRFGKNRGARSMTKAWKSAAVVHDATYLLYRRNEDDSVVPNENVLPKHVRQTFCDDEIASLARLDVVGKLALKLINETLRTSIKFRKIGTIKKQIERFNGNGDGIQFAAVVAADPRKVYADDEVTPPPKKDEDENIHVSSLPPSEKDISDARHDAKIIRARLLAGIGLNDIVANANIDLSALQRKFRVCAVARPNNDGASLYFNANWGPIVLKSLVNRGAYAAGVCEWSDLGVWRGANVEHLRSIFNGKETIKPDTPRTRIVLRFPKKGVGKKGDAVYDEGGSIKIGNIDRVTPVSIAIAVASASVLASEWSEIASKRKKGGVKVLVKSATKGDVRAFAFSATETNGDFSWW